jgi:hypothetical protein
MNKNRANKMKKEFQLTIEDFHQIIEQPCYLCGKCNTDIHQNGIDRVDNTLGYLFENCKSCCGTCNKLKKDIPLFYFLKKLQEIYIHITNKSVYDEHINSYMSIIHQLQNPTTIEELLYSQIIQSDIQLDNIDDKLFVYRKWLHYHALENTLFCEKISKLL